MEKIEKQRKTVNIAVIGSGFMGKEHTKAYNLAKISCPQIAATPVLKILCDADEPKVKERAYLWGYEEYCTDYHEILERDDIDIVDICTTAITHADMCIDFIKANKFFICCEKPLVTLYEDGLRLMEVYREYKPRTAVGFNKRRWPAVTYARQLVKEGVLGDIVMYNGRYCQGGLAARLAATVPFYRSLARSGGFADSGSHAIDMARFILDDEYESVVARAYPLCPEIPSRAPLPGEDPNDVPKIKPDSEDFALIIGQMKSGLTCSIYQSGVYNGTGEDISYEVHGTKGTVRWSGANPSLVQLCTYGGDRASTAFKDILMGPAHPYGDCVPFLPGFGVGVSDNMSFQAYEVINAFVSGKEYDPNFEDAWDIVRVCEAARRSERERRWVDIKDVL